MNETAKKPTAVDLMKERQEREEKEVLRERKKIPSVNDLLKSIPFLKSFAGKMNSQVFKTDTLHIMHTACMMEILEQLKLMNENLENLLDAQEVEEEESPRTSKKLSRDK